MKKYLLFIMLLSYFSGFAQTEAAVDSVSQRYELTGLTIKSKKKLKRGDRLVLNDLNFKGGTSELLSGSEEILRELLRIMKENPNLKILIQGHICCRTDVRNEVSEARARVVWVYLLMNEIENDRVAFKDYGGTKPIFPIPERNEIERRQNRRVEIEILSN